MNVEMRFPLKYVRVGKKLNVNTTGRCESSRAKSYEPQHFMKSDEAEQFTIFIFRIICFYLSPSKTVTCESPKLHMTSYLARSYSFFFTKDCFYGLYDAD